MIASGRAGVRKGPLACSLLDPVLLVALLGAALLLLGGCGSRSQGSAEEERTEAGTTTEGTGGAAGSTTGETTAELTIETTEGTTGEAAGAEKPYTAVVPPSGAEPQSASLDEVLVEGAEDTSDGPLKENRLVAYYGNPRSAQMGVLGETDPQTMMENLKAQTVVYSAADPARPAVPTIELIASVAQRDPGEDGSFLSRLAPEEIEEYASLAEENGALLLLDIQLGLNTISDEIEVLRPFLERPYVHLAIDTEYAVESGQVPGVDLGGVDGAQIQGAVETLTQLVEEKGIPDKVLVVHQFEPGIVTNKQLIEATENVEVVLNADGFGLAEAKIAKYNLLVSEEPIQYGGFKLFYTQDTPLLSPEQVLQLDPAPVVVNYQ